MSGDMTPSAVRSMIEEFIASTPAGTTNQTEVSQPQLAGNGKPKRGRPPTRTKRAPTQWNIFLKEFAKNHPDVPLAEAAKLASVEYRKLQGKPAAKKPAPKDTDAAEATKQAKESLEGEKAIASTTARIGKAAVEAGKTRKPPKKPRTAAQRARREAVKKAIAKATEASKEDLETDKSRKAFTKALTAAIIAAGPEGAYEEFYPATPPRLGGPPESFRYGSPLDMDPQEFVRKLVDDPKALAEIAATKEGVKLKDALVAIRPPKGTPAPQLAPQEKQHSEFMAATFNDPDFLAAIGKKFEKMEASAAKPTEKEELAVIQKEIEKRYAAEQAKSGKQEGGVLVGGLDFKAAAEEIKRRLKGVTEAFKGTRTNWPPAAREVLEKYGNRDYSEVKVCRKPLADALQTLIKTAALPKRGNFDKFYHLSLWLKIGEHEWLRLDKREVLHAVIEKRDTEPGAVCIPVRVGPNAPKTVNGVIDNALKKVGPDRFYKYRSTSWNCQRWVLDLLEANDMHADKAWILQSVKGLLSPLVDRLANLSTDLKARANLILEGFGLADPDEEFMVGLGKLTAATTNTLTSPTPAKAERIEDAHGPPSEKKASKAKVAAAYKKKAAPSEPFKTKDPRGGKMEIEIKLDGDDRMMEKMRKFISKRLDVDATDQDVVRLLRDEEYGGVLIAGAFQKKPMSNYQKALMEWNASRSGPWKIPKKGSAGHKQVKSLQVMLDGQDFLE